jgi:hypothetical protein
MVLTHASPARLELSKRSSVRAPVLTAVALALLASSALLAPGPVTLSRSMFAATLFAVCGLIIATCLPQRARVRLSLDTGLCELDERKIPLARARFLSLETTGSRFDRAARSRYRVELVFDGGERCLLLERADPAAVLRDLRVLLRHWALPVRTGWGLPPGAEPWLESCSPVTPPAEPIAVHARPLPGELGTGLAVLGGALVIGTAMTLMHLARMRRGEPTDALSFALSAVTLTLILAIAVFMLGDRVHAAAEGHALCVRRSVLGLPLKNVLVPLSKLRGIYATGMNAAEPTHLLVDGEELVALPFASEAARRFAEAFSRRS